MMDDSPMDGSSPLVRRVAVTAAAVVLGVAGLAYAVHERHAAEALGAQNQQVNAELNATRSQMKGLTAEVNALEQRSQQEAAVEQAAAEQQQRAAEKPIVHRLSKPRAGHAAEARWRKMQAQLDEQGKEIAETRGDLDSTRTALTGSIAKTHDELVVLEKRGQRNYFEFDLTKSKQYSKEGPVGISLRKANLKHQYADLQLMVDDRDLTQKHVNLYQPVMFYQEDSEQPIQVIINSITKDHIHGYVSAPMYRKSELTSMADSANGANPDAQTAPRKVLTVPQQ
jgi:outer membrane murein-binding lipoprotein Lpp